MRLFGDTWCDGVVYGVVWGYMMWWGDCEGILGSDTCTRQDGVTHLWCPSLGCVLRFASVLLLSSSACRHCVGLPRCGCWPSQCGHLCQSPLCSRCPAGHCCPSGFVCITHIFMTTSSVLIGTRQINIICLTPSNIVYVESVHTMWIPQCLHFNILFCMHMQTNSVKTDMFLYGITEYMHHYVFGDKQLLFFNRTWLM